MSVVNKAPKANRAPVLNPMEAITLESGETYALHAGLRTQTVMR